MLANKLPEALPCQCQNPTCGYSFIAPNPIGGGGSNIRVSNIATNCPRCGSRAKYPDWHTDVKGKFHFDEILTEIGKIKDTGKLKLVKESLKAANDDFSAEELADTLVELDPAFAKFKGVIKKLPSATVMNFVTMLFTFVSLILVYQQLQVSEETLESSNSFQQQQLDLAKEQFEYQKEQDRLKVEKEESSKDIELKLEAIKREFEKQFKELEVKDNRIKPRPLLSAGLRNKPCPCGSGKKAKKCHSRGVA